MNPLVWFAAPLLAACVAAPPTEQARSAAASTPSPQSPIQVSAGLELRHDRFHYRFTNESRFDTPFLVPHSFAQSYVADNRWLVGRARYRLRGMEWRTDISMTPTVQTFGDDFDTFFQPGGDIVTSGTAGGVRLRSWGLAQTMRQPIESRSTPASELWVVAGYRFRHDRSDFLPADRIVTHTLPPSESRTPVSTRETTRSHVHEILFGLEWDRSLKSGWRTGLTADVAPTVRARLSTRLPDKYPGEDIVFTALAATASATVSLSRTWQHGSISVVTGASRGASYLRGRTFGSASRGLQLRVTITP